MQIYHWVRTKTIGMRKSDFVHCSIKTYTYFKVYNAISGALVILRGPFVTFMTPYWTQISERKNSFLGMQ